MIRSHELFEIFDPGYKYLREERERRKIMVAQPAHGGGPPPGIDLNGGTARISIRRGHFLGPDPLGEIATGAHGGHRSPEVVDSVGAEPDDSDAGPA